jgi:hypothetical protein
MTPPCNKTLILIGLLEAFYVVYFLRFFKTTTMFDHGIMLKLLKKLGINSKAIIHPTRKVLYPVSMICPFGHFMSWVVGFWLLVRFLLPFKRKYIIYFNLVIITLIFIVSWMNMNAVIYLLPFIIFDLGLQMYLLNKN